MALAGTEIVNRVINCDYQVKSVRKDATGEIKVTLDNKACFWTLCDVKTTKALMETSRAHQLKAMVAWQHTNSFKNYNSSNSLPGTETSVFLIKEYITKVKLFVERLISIYDETVQDAVKIGNAILALNQPKWVNVHDDEIIKDIIKLQNKIGQI